ncbi:MAG: ThuA domain-containing protein [Planctomycetales bacterium]|nr:ThuA domain-containing protein [Planctomycetales bacterium]
MSRHLVWALLAATLALVLPASAGAETLELRLRSRVPIAEGAAQFHLVHRDESWESEQTAFIVCDMWDAHHCLNAVRRVGEMAPRMNRVLQAARERGALIVHAPSSCMEFYRETPARLRAMQVPAAKNVPEDIGQWCRLIPSEEQGAYPIDQSDGGEDDDPAEHDLWASKLQAQGRNPRSPWIRQVATIEIDQQRDAISDNGVEIWNLLEHRGIRNVVLLGVHTNMCVLGRPFGLRQMAKNGKHVVLMRDMTDTMYNPAREPHVSHFTGTDLIVEHIEKWVCPTVTSDQLIGGAEFRFSHDRRPHVVMLIGEREYRTNESLPKFAVSTLGKDFRVTILHAEAENKNSVPGIETIADADVLLVSMRRRLLPIAQLKYVRDHVAAGKPVVGIRTANHAFTVRGDVEPGADNWPEWDEQVIGGSYTGHYKDGPVTALQAAVDEHPILKDVDLSKLKGHGSLYKVSPLRSHTQAVLVGSTEEDPEEPVAWTHLTATGGRVFYTSLGHIEDFEQPAFHQLLLNAVRWSCAP